MTTQQSEMEVLKSQVKTLKRIVYGVVCLFVVGIALAATSMQGVPDVIEAKMFRVVNDEGKAMAMLRAYPLGGFLSIRNKDEKTVATLMADSAGSRLDIWNKQDKSVVTLGSFSWGGWLGIANNDGKVVFQKPEKEAAGP